MFVLVALFYCRGNPQNSQKNSEKMHSGEYNASVVSKHVRFHNELHSDTQILRNRNERNRIVHLNKVLKT